VIAVHDLVAEAGPFRIGPVSFHVPTGAHAALMGRTGTGKTTLLEAMCGLRPVRSGRVELMGRDVTDLKPATRGVGYVPQDLALFTPLTVRRQLAFGPTVHRWRKQQIEERVDELAGLLGIRHLLDRTPQGLSGGEAQRVALGRALAVRPGILLLDEPLGALDDQTREEMYGLLQSVRAATGVTTLHVTHNHEEAERLADVFLSLEGGVIRQTARPAVRWTSPSPGTPGEGGGGGSPKQSSLAQTPSLTLPRSTGGGNEGETTSA
jgi:molybdate/tungstate transport system ATP-binding protein